MLNKIILTRLPYECRTLYRNHNIEIKRNHILRQQVINIRKHYKVNSIDPLAIKLFKYGNEGKWAESKKQELFKKKLARMRQDFMKYYDEWKYSKWIDSKDDDISKEIERLEKLSFTSYKLMETLKRFKNV